MKKQINPTIKAHLIRSAFYLLLLLAVCAIPFALAQSRSRGTTNRSVAKSANNPNTVAKLATVAAERTKLSNVHSKAASQPNTSSSLLPYDVRSGPSLPRMSDVPQRTSGVGAAHIIPMPPAPKAPQVVLYDRYNNASTTATLSATFTDFPNSSADLADDFVVPGGQTWNVMSIDADGVYFNGPGPATDWNVFIYTDSATLPGTQIFSATNIPISQVGTTFTANLPVPAVLTAGTYWIEIQANMTFGTQGEWGWTDRTVQSNSGAAFRNPGGDFGCGTDWVRKPVCVTTAGGPDQVYRLNGTTGGGGTPTPTPTGSPSTCNNYIFNTSTGNTIEPGTTDTGNHTDDGTTVINLPFSVQFYDQSFTTAIVGSNGTLGFVANGNAFTNACLPAAAENMAILPHWDDLQTNTGLTGCSTWANGCGIFTSVSGTAPNRIFNIEWHAVFFANNATTADFEIRLHESTNQIDLIYGDVFGDGTSATVGVQRDTGSAFTQFECNSGGITSGLGVTFTCAGGGGSPTPTPTATATGTPSGCVINGSIDSGDPTQVGRLFRSAIPQTCPPSTTCDTFDTLPHHYDAYTFTNTTGSMQCVTVDTNTACTGTNFIFIAAYLGSFDPNNICTNWIGDSGPGSPNPDQPFDVEVPDGQTFVVVVSEVTPEAGCAGYTVTITPSSICGGGGSPTRRQPLRPPVQAGGTPGPWMSGSPYPTTDVRYGFAQTATHFYVFGGVDNERATLRMLSIAWISPLGCGSRARRCRLPVKHLRVPHGIYRYC